MDHKLSNQILKVSALYIKCPDKAIKKAVGRIIAGDYGRLHRVKQRAETR